VKISEFPRQSKLASCIPENLYAATHSRPP
jgi:hypothetical protein